MRILILEDNSDRIEWFRRVYKHQDLHITKSINEALRWTLFSTYDIMFLDHDLEGYGPCENTGYAFVKGLIEEQTQKRALIYIHSMNPTGANIMLNALRDNGYDSRWVPFNLLIEEEKQV